MQIQQCPYIIHTLNTMYDLFYIDIGWHQIRKSKKNPILLGWGFLGYKSLTMSYFHTGIRTIIGAEAFHFPVRYGKEWYHLAMVIRHNFLFA